MAFHVRSRFAVRGHAHVTSAPVYITEGCRYHGDPPLRHGPYSQYTRKLAGKTLTRRLDAQQAQRYRAWIANRHRLDELPAEMDALSRQAADLIITPPTRHPAQRTSDQGGGRLDFQKCGTSVKKMAGRSPRHPPVL